MQTCIGVYLHGFLSSGNSEKGQWFKAQANLLADANEELIFDEFITPTYPIKTPQESVEFIENLLLNLKDKWHKVVLFGSSMGGYYAQYLGQKYGVPYILINPALRPIPVFKEHIGHHVNPSTHEPFCIDNSYIASLQTYDVKSLNNQVPAMLLIDTDDEVIDVDYALQAYNPSKSKQGTKFTAVIYTGGDHRFIHLDQAWLNIKQFIKQL